MTLSEEKVREEFKRWCIEHHSEEFDPFALWCGGRLSALEEEAKDREQIKTAIHKGVMALGGSVAGKQIHEALDAFAEIREIVEAAAIRQLKEKQK